MNQEMKEKASNKVDQLKESAKEAIAKIERERDFAGASKTFKKLIEENAKNKGISEEQAKQELIEWTKEYYTSIGDIERRDRYLEAILKIK